MLVLLSYPISVRAQESSQSVGVTGGQIDEALLKLVPIRFLPNHPLYILITVKEKFSRIFQPSAANRTEFDFILSGKRLKETYLLIEADKRKINNNLSRYSTRLASMLKQLEKARSQNQDIGHLIGVMSAGLEHHERLLIVIGTSVNSRNQKYSEALSSFEAAVIELDKFNPGLKGRFKILKNLEKSEDKLEPSPSIEPFFNDATNSAQPRRIIL